MLFDCALTASFKFTLAMLTSPVVSYAFIYRALEPARAGRQRQPTAAARALAEENEAKKQRVGGVKKP